MKITIFKSFYLEYKNNNGLTQLCQSGQAHQLIYIKSIQEGKYLQSFHLILIAFTRFVTKIVFHSP